MKLFPQIVLVTLGVFAFSAPSAVRADIIISEVMSSEGGTNTYGADWFELTNTGSSSVDITGWKMDDNSNSFSAAQSLLGVTSIAAGQSVVFVEGNSTTIANFKASWFGSSVPLDFTIGSYSGSNLSLSSSGDEVNIFDSTGLKMAGLGFGAATAGKSFDNAAGVNSTGAGADTIVSTLSSSGTHGAFLSPTGETGSPGLITAAPEPGAWALMLGGLVFLAGFQVVRRKVA